MDALLVEDGATLLFERHYKDASVRFTVTLDDQGRSTSRFVGRGTWPGAKAYVSALDGVVAALGRGESADSLCDLREVTHSPVRAQFLLGKWLFRNKKSVGKAAIFGGRTWEMKIARAVFKIARMERVGFFDDEASARRFLGWPAA